MRQHLVLQIDEMDSAACERRLTSAVERIEGVCAASADATAGVLDVEFSPEFDPKTLAARVVEADFTTIRDRARNTTRVRRY